MASTTSTPATGCKSCSLVVEHRDGRLEVLRWPRALTTAVLVDDNAPFEDDRAEAQAEAA